MARGGRRYGILAAAVVTLIAIAPQLYICFSRGHQWHGASAQTHGDETVYAAYLNALIDSRLIVLKDLFYRKGTRRTAKVRKDILFVRNLVASPNQN